MNPSPKNLIIDTTSPTGSLSPLPQTMRHLRHGQHHAPPLPLWLSESFSDLTRSSFMESMSLKWI
ncbi:uncharacterized protein DS421_17g574970 [Arachis hypogaea]|nr:uncharacterized protein DS421_17g574970 [Arachis hypogaea]